MRTATVFYFASLVLLPFYAFDSGLPQPAHAILFAGALLAIAANPDRRKILTDPLCRILGLFVAYVFIVNAGNLFFAATFGRGAAAPAQLDYVDPFTYAAFYAFNFVIFCGILCLALDPARPVARFWAFLVYAVLASLLVQVALAVLDLGKTYSSYRSIMFFNNPNQLAYYALCAATILMLCHAMSHRFLALVLLGYALALYLSALALSKAGLIAVLGLPFIYLINGPNRSTKRIAMIGIAAVLVFLAASYISESVFLNLEQRFSSMGEQGDDTLAARAYDRIVDYPRYILFGAGEGMRFRFNNSLEIHSLFGTLLFSYGVVGVAIVGVFVARLVVLAGIGHLLYLAPIAFYNLTHNGVRSPLMWIVMAMITVKILGALPATSRHNRRLAGAEA